MSQLLVEKTGKSSFSTAKPEPGLIRLSFPGREFFARFNSLPALRSRRGVSIAPDAQSIRDAIDVVEPGCDERDLEDSSIIEANGVQSFVIAL